tara:strand:- start:1444 stop:1677 length:234 start_codon:yes stop_codon:yes gene_type:complete
MPFKSEKQRRYLYANKPEVAEKLAYRSGGMVKRALGNIIRLPDLARMRSGGMVGNGSLTPGKVGSFKKRCEIKFRDS